MKVIDILNKIANGEKVPKFKYRNCEFSQFNTSLHNDTDGKWIEMKIGIDKWGEIGYTFLNDEVEILGEEKKDNFTGWKMYQDGKEVCSMDYSVEEKKIPEKLEFGRSIENGEEILTVPSEKMIIIKINEIIDYLDYLKSKGE